MFSRLKRLFSGYLVVALICVTGSIKSMEKKDDFAKEARKVRDRAHAHNIRDESLIKSWQEAFIPRDGSLNEARLNDAIAEQRVKLMAAKEREGRGATDFGKGKGAAAKTGVIKDTLAAKARKWAYRAQGRVLLNTIFEKQPEIDAIISAYMRERSEQSVRKITWDIEDEKDFVRGVCNVGDGSWVATAFYEKPRLYSRYTPTCLRQYTFPDATIGATTSQVVSIDNNHFAVGGVAHHVDARATPPVWNAGHLFLYHKKNSDCVRVYKEPGKIHYMAKLGNHRLLTVSADSIKQWDKERSDCVYTFNGKDIKYVGSHHDDERCFAAYDATNLYAYVHDGGADPLLAVNCEKDLDGVPIRFPNLSGKECSVVRTDEMFFRLISDADVKVRAVPFAHVKDLGNGYCVAAFTVRENVCKKDEIVLYHRDNKDVVCTFKGHKDPVAALDDLGDGCFVSAAGKEMRVWKWNAPSKYEELNLKMRERAKQKEKKAREIQGAAFLASMFVAQPRVQKIVSEYLRDAKQVTVYAPSEAEKGVNAIIGAPQARDGKRRRNSI